VTLGAIFGITFGTLALMAWGFWAIPLVLLFTLAGILLEERLS
jgi:hypothetical protein